MTPCFITNSFFFLGTDCSKLLCMYFYRYGLLKSYFFTVSMERGGNRQLKLLLCLSLKCVTKPVGIGMTHSIPKLKFM